MKKLIVVLLSGVICLLGTTFVLAYNEAPMLRVKVAAGELPPVEERLPDEPFVEEPFEEIGQYGGILQVFHVMPNAWEDMQPGISTWMGLFGITRDGSSTLPDIAKGFEWSKDLKTFTIYLRKGLKWSDGYPFTVDDILFQLEDIYGNEELTPTKPTDFSPGGKFLVPEKVDDYTIRINFSIPYPVFEFTMQTYRSWQTHLYSPKHYLKKWHIKYNPKANELVKEEGFDDWTQAFSYHAQNFPQQEDLNLPRMLPWVLKKKTTDSLLFERNSYYWKVDSAGNQLPYIDQIRSSLVSREVYQIKAISGEADYASFNLSLDNYPLYKENEGRGDYRVLLSRGGNGLELGLSVNLNEKDPVKREIYQDVRFRQALSLAINRDEINNSLYFGKAIPRQGTVNPTTSFYKKEWGEYYAQYDSKRANQLLDEIGLDKRNKDGIRLLSDGRPLVLIIEYVETGGPRAAILELVREYWQDIGIKTSLKEEEHSLFWEQHARSSKHEVMTWHADRTSESYAYVMPILFYPPGIEFSYAYDWGQWLETGGKKGEEPPQDVKDHYARIQKWQATKPGSKEYIELAQEVFDYFMKKLWIIGTVGMAPIPHIFKNNLRNVPDPTKDIATPEVGIRGYADLFFFKR